MSVYDVFLQKRINGVKLFKVNEFDYDFFDTVEVCKRPSGNPHGKKIKYLDVFCSFDIETSRIKEIDHSFMYVWMFGIESHSAIIGRTWWEFKEMLLNISKYIPEETHIKIWVHNLAYEFSFLKGIYKFTEDDVFILDGRRVVKCTILDKIEFHCSYVQTNMSLSLLTKKYDVEHKKLSGDDFDYNIIRYPWDELSDTEISYCVNDVIGLNEAMKKRAEDDGDNIYTMPLTSTGYVRRDCKRAMQKDFPHKFLLDTLPDYATYELLEECFRGGDTHANRFYAGQIINNVVSFDRASSYPDVIMNCLFPMGEWFIFDMPSKSWLDILTDEGVNALLIHATFYDVSLSNRLWGATYIPKHKCRSLEDAIIDNGRVLKAKKLEMVFTDVDYKIIRETYNCDIEVHEIRFSRYNQLPEPLRVQTLNYYKNKTELKGIEEQKTLYEKSKNLLNSIYGMCAQKMIKQNTLYVRDDENQFRLQSAERKELFDKSNKKAWLSYAWSVWVTSWARFRLYEGQKIAGLKFIYADTDSVKFIDDKEIREAFKKYNDLRIADSERNGAYADDKNGVRQYMGVYELDGIYNRFVTLGAKKYCYEDARGLHITVAGVNKIKGAKELETFGGIEKFRLGIIFKDAGGLEAIYNDRVCFEYPIGDKKILVTDNVCLKPSTYTMGLTDDYLNLISAERGQILWD